VFTPGTPLRKLMPAGMKVEMPKLTCVRGRQKETLVLPLGATIWRDCAEQGFLVLRYMDKRFAAFGSDTYILVDMYGRAVLRMVGDVVHVVPGAPDGFLVGVQRIPTACDGLDPGGGTDYSAHTKVLFVIRLEDRNRRYARINVRTGPDLPDGNESFGEGKDGAVPSVCIRSGVLHYEWKGVPRTFRFGEFDRCSALPLQGLVPSNP